MTLTQEILTIAAVVAGTMATRFLPFLLFPEGRQPPAFVRYLGTVLPSAVIGLLVVFCLKDAVFTSWHGLPEVIGILFVGFGIGGLLNLMASLVIAVYGRYDFMAANSLVSPIASLIQKAAFVVLAVGLTASHGDYTLPYAIFIGVDVVGMILLLLVTNKCKGKQ